MITILMFNNSTNRMETFQRNLNDPMPYNTGGTLSVREFRGSSRSGILWSSTNTMNAWNTFRSRAGRPIHVGFAFRRIGEGRHANQSQHYAGTAFDIAQNLNNTQRAELRSVAVNSGVWSHIDPASATPTWIHVDARQRPPACSAGYPLLRRGDIGNYVTLLQDALQTVGMLSVGIDGIFGPITEGAVQQFQRESGLTADGVVGCATWTALTSRANGSFC